MRPTSIRTLPASVNKQELHGSVDAARPSPYADEEEHGDDHQLPEDVEEEEIRRREEAHHRRLGNEERGVEVARAVLDRGPGHAHAEDAQHHGEKDERDADSVDPHPVDDVPGAYPWHGLDELESRRRLVEAEIERRRDRDGRERRRESDPPGEAVPQHEDDDRSQEREERRHRQNGIARHKPKITTARAARAPTAIRSP